MLYLIRHGETAWNAAGRYQGALDSPLTERGRRQAALIGDALAARLDPSAAPLKAYVSPLGRTRETAAIIARRAALDIQFEPRIAEVSLGPWDGLTDFEIDMEHPGARAGANRHDWYFRAPGGETLESVLRRVTSWLNSVSAPAVVISHGLAGRIIRGVYLGLSDAEMLRLPVPQDGYFSLTDGRAEFIPPDPAPQ